MNHYDVIILGAGLAGSTLARHLGLAHPELSVLCLESASEVSDRKVGESTVEVASHYLVRRLGLGAYLYQHQLPKNGLRFFFDSEAKDLPLEQMSEIGSDHLPFHPSFQLERTSLERDLIRMNRDAGVEVRQGAKVVDVQIDGASQHTVRYEERGEAGEATCRWVIDATGRRQLLLRKLKVPIHKETRLSTGAAWGRYRGVADLDATGSDAWRARVRYTSRHLSTNHLMYDGYWIWFIPLAGDLMSVGVVFDKDRVSGPRTQEQFETFLRSHRAVGDLLRGSTAEDFQAYAHLPYWSDTYFSTDRWAVTGEAGAFVDPFYSPGSDFIATSNELIVAMIESEIAGEGFDERVAVSNQFFQFKYESTLGIYQDMYPLFGSFEVFRLKYMLDFNNYYNLIVAPFMANKIRDLGWLREELAVSDRICQGVLAIGKHLGAMSEHVRARGEYFARNEGHFSNALIGVEQLEPRLGPHLDGALRRAEVDLAFGSVFSSVIARVTGEPTLFDRARAMSECSFAHVALTKHLDQPSIAAFFRRVGARLARDLRREFPSLTIAEVRFSRDRLTHPEVIGPAEGSAEHRAVTERALQLWDIRGGSVAPR